LKTLRKSRPSRSTPEQWEILAWITWNKKNSKIEKIDAWTSCDNTMWCDSTVDHVTALSMLEKLLNLKRTKIRLNVKKVMPEPHVTAVSMRRDSTVDHVTVPSSMLSHSWKCHKKVTPKSENKIRH
jgi:hypothetical protein